MNGWVLLSSGSLYSSSLDFGRCGCSPTYYLLPGILRRALLRSESRCRVYGMKEFLDHLPL